MWPRCVPVVTLLLVACGVLRSHAQDLAAAGAAWEFDVDAATGVLEHVQLKSGGSVCLHSPAGQLWSVAMDWQNGWPCDWYHAAPASLERVGDVIIARGTIVTPVGEWQVSDAYLRQQNRVRCTRRFQWKGEQPAKRCTLSVRFVAPGTGPGVVMPGVLYHGNPSGARSGRVPVYEGRVGEEALFEEHRFPMPFVSFEWQTQAQRLGAALHTVPSPAPFAHRRDQWWSLGSVAIDGATELTLLSGPCAANDKRSSIKLFQGSFGDYDDAYLTVPPGGIIEKTFYLQGCPARREGSAFQAAVQTSLDIFQPYSLLGLPGIDQILQAKARFAMTRWRDTGSAAGFRKYPEGMAPVFVIGWCGQAAAPGYALQVLGDRLHLSQADEIAQKSLDTIASAAFYEDGFHTWYDYEKDSWSRVELVSQGQGMCNVAMAIRVGRRRGLNTTRWEEFLRHACDVHTQRILREDWSPLSTNEGFFIAPLCMASELLDEPRYLQAARKAADVYGQRHVSMREPYWGGTLDASCEDKEGAYAALQGFLAVHNATGEKKYLDWARHAMDVVLTYVCVWDIDMPAGRLRDHAFKTRGWTAVSVQNMHIDVFGVLIAPEIYRMGELLQSDELRRLALLMFRSCGQLLDAYGSQGEQPQHTNYAQGGDLGDPAGFRGGYHETWTVFWITAHFLNAAAQLQEMGVSFDQ